MLFYSRLPGAKWWTVVTVAACGLILVNNTVYVPGGSMPRFLLEKGDWVQNPWWLSAFAFHIVGTSVCMLAGTPLVFPEWTRRHRAWHRRLGYVYVNAVLWVAAPSGLALSLTAKGGLWGASGFALAGIFWWGSTWAGYQSIRRGDIPAHIRAMVRSYCWALTAPAFRAIQILLLLLGVEDRPNYILSLWLSIAASVWLAESFLQRGWAGARPYFAAPSPNSGVIS